MANLRIIHTNLANTTAAAGVMSITATDPNTAGGASRSYGNPANLRTVGKTTYWSWYGSAEVDLTCTWTTAQTVRMVSFPMASLSATATVRIRGYTLPTDTTPVFDTGAVTAVATPNNLYTKPNVNSYYVGAYVSCTKWFAGGAVRKVVVTINDAERYAEGLDIQAAMIVVGGVPWSPSINCDYGAQIGWTDLSKTERNGAGDVFVDTGPRFKTLKFDLSLMPNEDRTYLHRILNQNRLQTPIFVSITPEDSADPTGENLYEIYGRLSKPSQLQYQFLNQFNTQIELEEV